VDKQIEQAQEARIQAMQEVESFFLAQINLSQKPPADILPELRQLLSNFEVKVRLEEDLLQSLVLLSLKTTARENGSTQPSTTPG